MDPLAWFLAGMACGAVAGAVTRRLWRFDALLHAAVGLLGAAIGGLLLRPLGQADVEPANLPDAPTWLLSLGGATCGLALLTLLWRRTN